MTLPNLISLLRLFMVPIIVWLMLKGYHHEAFVVFALAGASDLLDGALARMMRSYSELGKYLDPIADKILLMSVFITLGFQQVLPSWLVILVAFRDFLILGGALLLVINNKPLIINPLFISKINTLSQIILISLALVPDSYFVVSSYVITAMIALVTITSFISGAAYVKKWFNIVNSSA